jgi:hypothetical protein
MIYFFITVPEKAGCHRDSHLPGLDSKLLLQDIPSNITPLSPTTCVIQTRGIKQRFAIEGPDKLPEAPDILRRNWA